MGDTPGHNQCQSCGAHVDPNLRRVFGDNDDLVQCCLECTHKHDVSHGASDNDRRDGYLSRGSLR